MYVSVLQGKLVTVVCQGNNLAFRASQHLQVNTLRCYKMDKAHPETETPSTPTRREL
jgi:hypothetical protein